MPPFPGRPDKRQMMMVHSTRNGVPPEGYTATGTPEPLPAGEPIPVAEPQEPAQEEHVPEEEHMPAEEPEDPSDQAAEADDNGDDEKPKRSHHKRR